MPVRLACGVALATALLVGCADRHRVGGVPIYGSATPEAPASGLSYGGYQGYTEVPARRPLAAAPADPEPDHAPIPAARAAAPSAPKPAPSSTAPVAPETMETSGGAIVALPAFELPHETPPTLPAGAAPPSYRVPIGPRQLPADAPAVRFADLSPSACRAEVKARKLPVAFEAKEVKHVAAPLRLTGPLHGVRFVTHPPPSPYGILDCRLALALDEAAVVLSRYGFTAMRLDSMHRPGAIIAGTAKRSQHSHGLAADVMQLTTDDGDVIPVEGNWQAGIGDVPCGPEAEAATAAGARRLRDVVCALAREGIFHHLLTPSANAAHQNHFHFDLQRDRTSRYLR